MKNSSESGQPALPIQHVDTHHSEEEHQISVSHSGYEYDNTEIEENINEENISESTEIVNNASPSHGISSSSDEESLELPTSFGRRESNPAPRSKSKE